MGVGLDASATYSSNLEYTFSDKRDNSGARSSVILNADLYPSLGLPNGGLSLEAGITDKVISANINAGYLSVGGSVGDKTSLSVGTSTGIGGGIYAGVKGETGKFYPTKFIKELLNQ